MEEREGEGALWPLMKALTPKSLPQVPSHCGLVFHVCTLGGDTLSLQQEPKVLAPAPPEKTKAVALILRSLRKP